MLIPGRIGELFLAPVPSEFLEAFPAVEVVLLLSGRLVSDDVAVLHTAAEQGLEGADPA